jgi:uncharacterized repeat protein (TIGR02543 family)
MRGKKIIGLSVFLIFVFAVFLMPGCGTQHNVSTYSVTYDANGATSGDAPTDPTLYQSDLSVTVLGNTGKLQKAGYTFMGWNTEVSGRGTKYVQGEKFSIRSANAILYAMWNDDHAHTVTYDGNGAASGTVPTDANVYKTGFIVTVLGNTGTLEYPSRTFAGWNTNAAGTGTNYTQGDAFTMGSADVILYAKWTTNPTYTVTYDGNGSTSGTVPIDTTNYETGESVTVLDNTGNLAKTGYSYTGWNTNADGTGETYSFGEEFNMGSANVTLYARWSANPTYTVTYNGNGQTAGDPPVDRTYYEHGQTVTLLGNTGNLEKTGYLFGNWNTLADGSGTTYAKGQTFSMGSANVNLYAKWIINNFTVSFNSQGGSAVNPQTINYGNKVTKPTDPLKLGATFAGWFKESDCTTPWLFESDIVTGETTLYAKWTLHQFTVAFDSQGGSFVSPETVEYCHKATRPVNPTWLGHTFKGWYKYSDCTESWDFDHDLVTTNITLYAGWEINKHKVTFNSQGGTAVNPQTIDYGNKAVMPAKPTKGEYALAGWYTDAACTDANKWTFCTNLVTSDVTLYAKWQEYSIGDRGPAGGWVFFSKLYYSSGWRYAEAAPRDLDCWTWGNAGIETKATGELVGDGTENTTKIINTYGLEWSYAALNCRELIVGDYHDWALPSRWDMDNMLNNLAMQGKGDFWRGQHYCTSTERDKDYMYTYKYGSEVREDYERKNYHYYCRPVRYF